MDKKNFKKLQKDIQLNFKNENLLKQAFVHRSYLNEHKKFELAHNERLEFLGDAVLELAVTEYLFLNYSNPEGELTNWRASLVNTKNLSTVAVKYNLEKYLYLSKGEQKDTGKARQLILGNLIEALIGAIYLDQGWETAKKFVEKNILIELPEILEKKLYVDPKSNFQEAAQEKKGVTPNYKLLKESGPDHKKVFEIGVFLNKKLVAKGKGESKQEAQEKAAEKALDKTGW
ncbi:MAG TPA: ribonuclease III [Patescibacteria group bacterium]|nr:ribonuclease III [Patescibacteria group bacterium]